MRYLRVRNWDRYQQASSKQLPWIKFYTDLLSPTKDLWYTELPDVSKALLHHLWLMARVHNGNIPESWLTREKLNLRTRVDLGPLLSCGAVKFISESELGLPRSSDLNSDSNESLSRARIARSEHLGSLGSLSFTREGECEGEPFDRDAVFGELWSRFPRPLGKKAARRHFDASVITLSDLSAIRRALDAYLADLKRRSAKQEFIQHGATWFNNWRDWAEIAPRVEPSKGEAKSFGMRTFNDVFDEGGDDDRK